MSYWNNSGWILFPVDKFYTSKKLGDAIPLPWSASIPLSTMQIKLMYMAIIEANEYTHKFISIKGTKMSGNDNTSSE